MICRGTTRAVVMLALLSITQTSWSADPTGAFSQKTERIRVSTSGNSLKFAISDPAARGLVGPATRQVAKTRPKATQSKATRSKATRSIRTVNHETFALSPRQQRVLIAQLGEDKARDALDALRSVTDDLDLSDIIGNDTPPTPNTAAPTTPPATRAPATPRTPSTNADVKAILERLNNEKASRNSPSTDDSSRAEQRKRELESLLRSVEEEDSEPKDRDVLPDDDLANEGDDVEPDLEDTYVEPATPESIYAQNTNYEEIPWTMGNLFDSEEKTFQEQCREQEQCRQMWECAGGRCMSPCDRWKRNLRRTYELLNGDCPDSNPAPFLTGLIVEPLLGYGLFGASVGGVGGQHCPECNVGLIAGTRMRPGTAGGLLGGGGPLGLGVMGPSCSSAHGGISGRGGLLGGSVFGGGRTGVGLLRGGGHARLRKGSCSSSSVGGCTSCGASGGQSATGCTCGG